jgi:hypothetical protein
MRPWNDSLKTPDKDCGIVQQFHPLIRKNGLNRLSFPGPLCARTGNLRYPTGRVCLTGALGAGAVLLQLQQLEFVANIQL